ncbi:MAG: hypothetical protein ICV67_02215 [Thermoleophilia bacterium]|nr:hypothetical protein [Thermoleophilia bacterium]
MLAGECTLIVEEEERTLRQWDYFHCPADTHHIFVGAGNEACAILMVGARREVETLHYGVSEVAAKYGASAAAETSDPDVAYADWPGEYRPVRLPWPLASESQPGGCASARTAPAYISGSSWVGDEPRLAGMRPASDELLLGVAAIAATLLGLLVVGVLFYVETGLRRLSAREQFAPYVRAAARLTMALYVIALATALALVALRDALAHAVFAICALAAALALVDFTRRARVVGRLLGPRAWSRRHEVVVWACVVVALAVPWALGGATPARDDLTLGALLALALGLSSTLNLLLSVFDLAAFDVPHQNPPR